MKVVVTGAAGLVGRALRELYAATDDVVALGHRDLDITDAVAVDRTVSELRPDVIFNCAVIGVDECEHDPDLARRVNVDGPALLARAAQESGAEFVHFSTNYVFDGNSSRPYVPADEARPVNVYGATKLEGETAAARACRKTHIVRTSWVYGEGKESFLATAARKLARGERVRAITDIWASTTYVADLVRRTAEIVAAGRYGTHHVVNDGVCSYADFAQAGARLVGADPTLIDMVSERGLMRAPRPRYTPMVCEPPLRAWEEALADFVGASPALHPGQQ